MFTRFTRSLSTKLAVDNIVAKQQFVVNINSETAILQYRRTGPKFITLISTNVPEHWQGRGVGKLLAKQALDFASEENLQVLCHCDFIKKVYEDNIDKYKNLNIRFELND